MYTDPRTAYLNTRATSSVHGASPHKLIALLLESCLEQLAVAKGGIIRNEIPLKSKAIKKAMDIIVNLQAILDFEKGGQIASNLDDLYTFCTNRLALANVLNDVEKINEAYRVVAEIKQGWLAIEGVQYSDER